MMVLCLSSWMLFHQRAKLDASNLPAPIDLYLHLHHTRGNLDRFVFVDGFIALDIADNRRLLGASARAIEFGELVGIPSLFSRELDLTIG